MLAGVGSSIKAPLTILGQDVFLFKYIIITYQAEDIKLVDLIMLLGTPVPGTAWFYYNLT